MGTIFILNLIIILAVIMGIVIAIANKEPNKIPTKEDKILFWVRIIGIYILIKLISIAIFIFVEFETLTTLFYIILNYGKMNR